MFIETEGTPNPATLKFLPGQEILGDKTADFPDADAALISPLAEALFGLEGVTRVFLGSDFVTVTKSDETDWQALKPQILGMLMEHLVAGRPILREGMRWRKRMWTRRTRRSRTRLRICWTRASAPPWRAMAGISSSAVTATVW